MLRGALVALGLLLLGGQDSAAVTIVPPFGAPPSASVVDAVTALGSGRWQFGYTVDNLTLCVVADCTFADGDTFLTAFDLPFFGDAAITSILDPTGWQHAIETVGAADPFDGFGGGTGWDGTAAWQDPTDPNFPGAASPFTTVSQVLHWFAIPGFGGAGTVGIGPESALAGFGYEAGFAGTKAPHQTVFQNNVGGLPISVSGDPQIPYSPSVAAVPEPASMGLLGVGTSALLAFRMGLRTKRRPGT